MSKVSLPDGGRQGPAPECLGTTCEITQPPQGDGLSVRVSGQFEKSLTTNPGKDSGKPVEYYLARIERYAMQSKVRSWLPDHRVGGCLRKLIPKMGAVKVFKREERASYGGLQTCGAIFVCPVCASKISECRCQEMMLATELWKAQGGTLLMPVFTVPHKRDEPLWEVLGRLSKAYGLMKNRKPYKALTARIGLVGSVRSLEVTYGANGWHVHFHVLYFVKPGVRVDRLKLQWDLLAMWIDANRSLGGSLPNGRGVDVQDAAQASKYMAKWGLEREMTKGPVKQGRSGNMNPWDLIRQGERSLFQEYADAFKGKKQLVWSKGLRDLLGLGKMKTDEDLAGEVDPNESLLGELDSFQWKIVLRSDRRGELLRAAEVGGWGGVVEFIQNLIRADGCPF